MCEYLYAAFSLKTEPDETLPAEHLETVERWRSVVLGVAAQEMLHWALVNNLLTAVGSAPYVARPHMPHQAKGYPAGVQLALVPFGERALRHFLFLERPEGMELDDAEGFDPVGPGAADHGRRPTSSRGARSSTPSGTSTGRSRPASATSPTGSARSGCSSARRRRRPRPESFGWPQLVPITDAATASQAHRRHRRAGRGRPRRLERGALRPLPRRPRRVAGDQGGRPDVRAGPSRRRRRRAAGRRRASRRRHHRPGHGRRVGPVQRQLRPDPADPRALPRQRRRGPRAARHAGAHGGHAHVRARSSRSACCSPRCPSVPSTRGRPPGANFQLFYQKSFLLPHRRATWIRFTERLDEAAEFADAHRRRRAGPGRARRRRQVAAPAGRADRLADRLMAGRRRHARLGLAGRGRQPDHRRPARVAA